MDEYIYSLLDIVNEKINYYIKFLDKYLIKGNLIHLESISGKYYLIWQLGVI